MKIIALSGGIATGKSTVSDALKNIYGFDVIDADEISREVSERVDVIERIALTFGDEYIIDKKLNRSSLADLIFSDIKKKKALEEILHPIIQVEYEHQKKMLEDSGVEIAIYDCPLLFEASLTDEADKILLVYCSSEEQIDRLIKRDGLSESDALNRINSQMPLNEKLQYADYIIYNNGSLNDLLVSIEHFVSEISN